MTKGEPTKPHTEEELRGKFFELGEPVWGTDATRALHADLMQLEAIPNIGVRPRCE